MAGFKSRMNDCGRAKQQGGRGREAAGGRIMKKGGLVDVRSSLMLELDGIVVW